MRDAGHGLAERRHFLRLQQLLIEVPRLVVQLLALADVADERLDAHGVIVGGRVGARRELDPDGVAVGAPQAQQVVVHGAVRREPLDERDARLGIDEAIDVEGPDVLFGRVARIAKNQLQMGVGGDRRRTVGADGADVHALVDRLELDRI